MAQKKLFIVSYDITCANRLSKALSIVRDYATGGQKSVFECFLTQKQYDQLYQRLRNMIHSNDRVMVIQANTEDIYVYGQAILPVDLGFFYIG